MSKVPYNNMRGNIVENIGTPQRATDAMPFAVPSMTTAERDAMTATNGMLIYNTTTNVFNFYENGSWVTK